MTSLGVLFAVDDRDARRLLGAVGDDDALLAIVEELEERWENGFVGALDKAWAGLHRALGDGSLDPDAVPQPLGRAVLGGDLLTTHEDYFVYFTPADQVPAVAAALDAVTDDALRAGYGRIEPAGYGGPLDQDDYAYTLEGLESARELWRAAAVAGRAVVFTVDQ